MKLLKNLLKYPIQWLGIWFNLLVCLLTGMGLVFVAFVLMVGFTTVVFETAEQQKFYADEFKKAVIKLEKSQKDIREDVKFIEDRLDEMGVDWRG